MPRPSWLLRTLVAVPAVLLLAGVVIARQAEVVERGALLDTFSSAYEVSLVRLLGVELYVDTSTDLADLLTAFPLLAVGVVLVLTASRLRGDAAGAFRAAGLGAAFLALDDLLAAHETLGHNLPVLAELPLIDHPDDVIVGVYAAVMAAFAWRYRALARGTPATPWLVAGIAGGAAVVHDVLPLHRRWLEESLEVVAAAGILAGAVVVALHHLRAAGEAGAPGSGGRGRGDRDAAPAGAERVVDA